MLMPGRQRDHRVRRLFDGFNQLRIDDEFGAAQTSHVNHLFSTPTRKPSGSKATSTRLNGIIAAWQAG
ncbi:MAG: hypothetical protein Kow0047_03960 [Anaerolineae bacterium]